MQFNTRTLMLTVCVLRSANTRYRVVYLSQLFLSAIAYSVLEIFVFASSGNSAMYAQEI